jgi:hypothetical protein
MDLVPRFDRVAELLCQIDHIHHCWPTLASMGTLPGGRLLALAVARFGVVGPTRATTRRNLEPIPVGHRLARFLGLCPAYWDRLLVERGGTVADLVQIQSPRLASARISRSGKVAQNRKGPPPSAATAWSGGQE